MTPKERAAMQQALEALVVAEEFVDRHSEDWYISGQKDLKQIRETITALREALAKQAEQEPLMITPGGGAFPFAVVGELEQAEQEPVAIDWEPLQNFWRNNSGVDWEELESAVKCAIAALGKPIAEQEPYYFGLTHDHTWLSIDKKQYDKLKPEGRMVCYAAPVRTKDLTDDEIEAIMVEQGDLRTTAFARAVIAADRSKNK